MGLWGCKRFAFSPADLALFKTVQFDIMSPNVIVNQAPGMQFVTYIHKYIFPYCRQAGRNLWHMMMSQLSYNEQIAYVASSYVDGRQA